MNTTKVHVCSSCMECHHCLLCVNVHADKECPRARHVYMYIHVCVWMSCVYRRRHGLLQNAPGAPTDSPDTARAMVLNLHKKWRGDKEANGDMNCVEVSPLESYAGEDM